MRELEVVGVRIEMPANLPILMLRERGGARVLPIWIGANEAAAIAHALDGTVPPRPLTHDLMANLLSELGHHDLRGVITQMDEGTFHAELHVDGHVVTARPSDVVALSVRKDFPVTCPEELLDRVGIVIDEPAEDEVERFREFLDTINPDDFDED